jgi:hypothetical protein
MARAECVMCRHRVRRCAKNESLCAIQKRFVQFGWLMIGNMNFSSSGKAKNGIEK